VAIKSMAKFCTASMCRTRVDISDIFSVYTAWLAAAPRAATVSSQACRYLIGPM